MEGLIRRVSILLLILSVCSADLLDSKYEIVNGVPYNKDAPRDENYPYCPRDDFIELEPGNSLTEVRINCTCSHPDDDFLPSFVCVGLPNITYLEAYFKRLFPTYLASRISVSSSNLFRIPADVFSDKEPKVITMYNNILDEIHPEAFRYTRPTLQVLEIDYEPELEYFPFTSLNEFPELIELRLNNNELRNITELADTRLSRLQILNLDNNKIETEFPKLRYLPELRVVSARNSLLSSISTELPFEELQRLEVINFNGNNIESIYAGSFVFDQQTEIRTIDLGNCNINSVEEGAFVGLLDSTELRLDNNELTTFSEDAFRETVETMMSGSGKIYLEGNLITCCCDVNWIVSNIPLQAPLVGATCAGNVLLTQLPPDYLNPLCPPASL
ncbi:leucine-rich repeat-containing protein egg-6-like [Artemia franciscana]